MSIAVLTNEAKVGVTRELLGERSLFAPGGPGLIHRSLFGYSTIEVSIRLRLRLVQLGQVLAGKPAPKPGPFHFCHVPDQTE